MILAKQVSIFGGKKMIETERLVLDKAKFSDWKGMYYNVWSQAECAKYMCWKMTQSEEDAQIRIRKTIEFQKIHDAYIVYEKLSNVPIGFAGVEKMSPNIYQETGVCLGVNYMRKGYGKEVMQALIHYCKTKFGAKEFIYSTREENEPSNKLAKSLGFKVIASEPNIDKRDGRHYNLLKYSLKL